MEVQHRQGGNEAEVSFSSEEEVIRLKSMEIGSLETATEAVGIEVQGAPIEARVQLVGSVEDHEANSRKISDVQVLLEDLPVFPTPVEAQPVGGRLGLYIKNWELITQDV